MRVPKDYTITNEKALLEAYPQFFKMSVDHAKIKKALSLGIDLPGVEKAVISFEPKKDNRSHA